MPKACTKKAPAAQSKQAEQDNDRTFQAEDDQLEDSPMSSVEADLVSKGKKRPFAAEENTANDFPSEMQKMLDCFGADITKTLIAKRKRLELFTQNTLKSSNKRVEDIWKGQQGDRQKLCGEFKRQVTSVFTQWDSDLDKAKEQEEKLQNLFKQQQKLFQQTRVVQSQRLKTIRQLHEQYLKGLEDLEQSHHDQQSNVQSELKKEMALLQKRILMDTQQQEMANVRKSLQTMLF